MKHHLNKSLFDIPNEQWKDIPKLDGNYQISNFGRVKRLQRVIRTKGNGKSTLKEKIMAQNTCTGNKNRGLRCAVKISFNNLKLVFHVKRLVMTAFGENKVKTSKNWIFHKDGTATNNHIDNLFYGTADNISDISSSEIRKRGAKTSKYKGVRIWEVEGKIYFYMKISINGKNISECLKNELECAKRYDYYIKKYKLKRKGNFINNEKEEL